MLILPKERGCDVHGCGHYGAPRGHRTHTGIDLRAQAGSHVLSHVKGTVTKIGYPYNPDGEKGAMRYVEITDADGNKHRFFYVFPHVELCEKIHKLKIIGEVQDVAGLYSPGMKNHVHYEVKTREGEFTDPRPFLDVQWTS